MRYFIPLLFAFFCAGCAAKRPAQPETYGAQIGIVNHTGKFIYRATVNGRGAASMERWGAGSAGLCCAILPLARQTGIKVRVKWDTPEGDTHEYHEQMVDLEMYDEGDSVYLHFFPDGRVRAVVSKYSPVSPNHPIPYRGKPE